MPNLSIIALVMSLVALTWCVMLTALVVGQKQMFRELGKGVTKKDLQSLLKQVVASLQGIGIQLESLHGRVQLIESLNKFHLQRVGFVRFNPFGDTGGDQSFCLCLLDDNNNGIVITSLHSREVTRLYAKEIQTEAVRQDEFSSEEWNAYQQAVKATNKLDANQQRKSS